MAVLKCKMCGAPLDVAEGATVAVCNYCMTKQTVHRANDEKKNNLYDRANYFRRSNDYDKAAEIFNTILNEDSTDAEAYWGLVLCKYGVEYVEDPVTKRRIPTVNRTQFASVYADEDYKSALQYADVNSRAIYSEEAGEIDRIQKQILEISAGEKPFDVFICYKETDENGRRTQDSVLATELYHELTREGFNVFFSRITLEDKIGTAYEPYIFAALNSSKVMVVLGTRADHFTAVWVKNEWSRYIALIKKGEKKTLVPAYRDMNPYDLPDDFSHLQALDMSKLGFMQDLIHGIKKLCAQDSKPQQSGEASVNSQALLRRAFIFLEDGNESSADEYCEKVLDMEPECAEAYLLKLMIDFGVRRREDLAKCTAALEKNGNYQRILRFGNDDLVEEIRGYNQAIVSRNSEVEEPVKDEGKAYERYLRKYPEAADKNAVAVLDEEIKRNKAALEKKENIIKNKKKYIIPGLILVLVGIMFIINGFVAMEKADWSSDADGVMFTGLGVFFVLGIIGGIYATLPYQARQDIAKFGNKISALKTQRTKLESIPAFRKEDYLFVTPSYEKAYRAYLRAYPNAEAKRELPKLRTQLIKEEKKIQKTTNIMLACFLIFAGFILWLTIYLETEFPWVYAGYIFIFFFLGLFIFGAPIKKLKTQIETLEKIPDFREEDYL